MRRKAALGLAALLAAWGLLHVLGPTAPVAGAGPGQPLGTHAPSTGATATPQAVPGLASAGAVPAPASASVPAAIAGPAGDPAPVLGRQDFGVEVWDLCGVGRVPVPPRSSASGVHVPAELPPHLGEDAQAAARQQLLAALDAGGLRARAVAAVWRGLRRSKPDGNPELQALARGASDPVVVAWALAQCSEREPCEGLSARDWVRLEPDNAAAWSLLLEKGRAQTPGVLEGLARARRYQLHFGVLAGTVLAAMPQGIAPYLQSNLLVEAYGVQATVGLPSMQPLANLCRPAPPAGSPAHGVCDAVARVLADHSDTLLGHRIGLRMGELAGWPLAEVTRRRAQADALGFDALQINHEQPYDCPSVARVQAWTADMARMGELAALRQRARAASAVAGR